MVNIYGVIYIVYLYSDDKIGGEAISVVGFMTGSGRSTMTN